MASQEAQDILTEAWASAMKEWNELHPTLNYYGSLGWPAVLHRHQAFFIDKALERQRSFYEANERWPNALSQRGST